MPSPLPSRGFPGPGLPLRIGCLWACALLAWTGAAWAEQPLAVRVQWGGGQPQSWTGTIAIVAEAAPADGNPAPESSHEQTGFSWQTLCSEPDAAACVHEQGGALRVHSPRPLPTDGVEILVADIARRKLVVELAPSHSGTTPVRVEVPLAEVLTQSVQLPLDTDGNRLTVRPAPGESLRVTIAPAPPDGSPAAGESPSGTSTTVYRPGDRIRCTVEPWLPVRSDGMAKIELTMRIRAARRAAEIAAETAALVPRAGAADMAGTGQVRAVAFVPVAFDVALPATEAAYDLELEVIERVGLGWARTVASRTVQVVAVADAPTPVVEPAEWKLVYELDPGSPKLHERLRRLPGSLPTVTLPAVPLPSLTRPVLPKLPGISLPNVPLPAVPFPNVPVPSVSAFVPRFSGLLATGHSNVESHALGPMLRLPPADPLNGPTWEGIVVAGAQPGMPHAVEIECPTDQEGILAVTVLELDPTGTTVQVRSATGVQLRREFAATQPRLAPHRFVFWPTSKQPLVVLANPHRSRDVRFGRVRISSGPERLPFGESPPAGGRRVHAVLPAPEFLGFGGQQRAERDGGRAITDWHTHLTGIRHSADSLRGVQAGGALVTVFGRGAAAWPSQLTRLAPRWDCGAGETSLDPGPKDLLEVLCRVYGREQLTLVPAIACDAPLPAIEQLVAGGGAAAEGIACVGRDGRPRRTEAGSLHYNILDPRVQQAVEAVVLELAARLSGEPAVDGIALLMPHDGWLHLPGVAWGLDDVTFSRFCRDVGVAEPANDATARRFAVRAQAVEGPLRSVWLEWRSSQIAAFHARIADQLVRCDDRLSLSVVPTTLFAEGAVADRFRPVLSAASADVDVLAEIGLDPARITAHRRVVFVTPWVDGGAALAERSRLAAANRSGSLMGAARRAARRAAMLIEQPFECSVTAVVPHGPFGTAPPPPTCECRAVVVGAERERGLAESLLGVDAERIYDMSLLLTAPSALPAGRAAFESLPAGYFREEPGLGPARAEGETSPSLVVRSRRHEDGTWLHVINPTAAPGRLVITCAAPDPTVMAVSGRMRLPLQPVAGEPRAVAVEIDAWSMRALWIEGQGHCQDVRIEYDADLQTAMVTRLADLRERRALLESPVPIDVLDNPGFEIAGGAGGASPGVSGWELVDGRRGAVQRVAGGVAGGQAIAFSGGKGLATLRSNPFARPPSGRISIAAWLRTTEAGPAPQLRIALEGIHGGQEFYRFAPIGGPGGGRPLTRDWGQYVLQIDDLPDSGLESLRVRFDLMSEGRVEIDEVRVFDLAFDETQRAQLTRLLDGIDARLGAGDVGGSTVDLEGHWPRYLETFVSLRPAPAPEATGQAGDTSTQRRSDERAGSSGRLRRWRQ